MRRLITSVVATLGLGTGTAVAADPLAEHRWHHRLLLLYVPTAGVPALEHFREQVRARQCGVDGRDLVVGEIIGMEAGALGEQALDGARVRELRRHHWIDARRVTTVLVGKDGGVKLRAEGIADLDRVFARIDGMPMRRREMADRGASRCG